MEMRVRLYIQRAGLRNGDPITDETNEAGPAIVRGFAPHGCYCGGCQRRRRRPDVACGGCSDR
jgi:hypothetical protein